MRKLAILSLAVAGCVYEVVEDGVKSYMTERDEGIRVAVTRGIYSDKDSCVHACTCLSPCCRERGTLVSLAFLILTSPSIVDTGTL